MRAEYRHVYMQKYIFYILFIDSTGMSDLYPGLLDLSIRRHQKGM